MLRSSMITDTLFTGSPSGSAAEHGGCDFSLMERQGHHAPVVPGSRHENVPVEVRVAARILHVCIARPARHGDGDDRIECLAAGAHDEFVHAWC